MNHFDIEGGIAGKTKHGVGRISAQYSIDARRKPLCRHHPGGAGICI